MFEERTRANTITVRWERPEISGRDDLYYNIFYSEDNQTFTQHNTRQYVKRDLLVDYSLSGLRPLTSYTIRVMAENGVSDQEERGETRSCEVAGRTGDIRKLSGIITFLRELSSHSLRVKCPLPGDWFLLCCGVDHTHQILWEDHRL